MWTNKFYNYNLAQKHHVSLIIWCCNCCIILFFFFKLVKTYMNLCITMRILNFQLQKKSAKKDLRLVSHYSASLYDHNDTFFFSCSEEKRKLRCFDNAFHSFTIFLFFCPFILSNTHLLSLLWGISDSQNLTICCLHSVHTGRLIRLAVYAVQRAASSMTNNRRTFQVLCPAMKCRYILFIQHSFVSYILFLFWCVKPCKQFIVGVIFPN